MIPVLSSFLSLAFLLAPPAPSPWSGLEPFQPGEPAGAIAGGGAVKTVIYVVGTSGNNGGDVTISGLVPGGATYSVTVTIKAGVRARATADEIRKALNDNQTFKSWYHANVVVVGAHDQAKVQIQQPANLPPAPTAVQENVPDQRIFPGPP